ncbi:hypothetical protein [Streptomyces physcomitrii]|uniref:Histidine kinase n=1 Tax=Streptomyces physcomitrii TaxID=2724184 RepID=A0ABX1HAU4_9ACTN|nr:hypothetical protein [Streptomyces physcomitrii]NKI44324.1 hypothetical protein [Streptomyces physcomitrii]
MPSIDHARRRLRLSDSHISVLGMIVEEEKLAAELTEARDALERAGLILKDGTLHAELYPLVSTLMDPRLIARIEVTGPQGVLSSGAVVGYEFAFSHEGWPGETESVYAPLEIRNLVWELARMVDLHTEPLDHGDAAEQIDSTVSTVDRLLEAVGDGEDAFEQAGAEVGAPARLAEVLAQLNCMWRITLAWRGEEAEEGGMSVTALAVWDCGLEGYWVRELPAEPIREGEVGEDCALRVRQTTAKEVWEKITDLLPEAEQFATGA